MANAVQVAAVQLDLGMPFIALRNTKQELRTPNDTLSKFILRNTMVY